MNVWDGTGEKLFEQPGYLQHGDLILLDADAERSQGYGIVTITDGVVNVLRQCHGEYYLHIPIEITRYLTNPVEFYSKAGYPGDNNPVVEAIDFINNEGVKVTNWREE